MSDVEAFSEKEMNERLLQAIEVREATYKSVHVSDKVKNKAGERLYLMCEEWLAWHERNPQ